MGKWKQQLIRYLFHYSAKRLRIAAAFVVKHSHVPSKLYKYRAFSSEHKQALSRGVLWRCSPDRFNDPYDSAVYFEIERFLMEDQSIKEFLASMESMKRKIDAGQRWSPETIKKPIQQREWQQKAWAELLRDEVSDITKEAMSQLGNVQRAQWENMVRVMSAHLRAGMSVLSLSENATSVLMWSHYSNNHSGFCIEYDLSALGDHDLRRRLCFPIFYRKKLTDATRYFAKQDPRDFNNLVGIYMCLLKSDEWAYEREWRIAAAVGASYANDQVQMPKPKAIIVGARILPADEEWMRAFCDRHAIPLKRVVQRHNQFRLEIRDFDPPLSSERPRGPNND
jgi:hypothetical protein